ncbi:MAG: glutathione peroxidase [Clostridiales bacterium]|nr:glutathione peroxidase [Clostridiales bacterium]
MSLYDITVKDMEGRKVSLSEYAGKVLLIVNTATGCGFTPQYRGLEELYEKYRGKGFEILDFPCNQFGNQAPGTESEIHEFCQLKYNVSFKQFAKIDVNGENESPLFTYLKSQKSGLFGPQIKWNFTKFLIDRKGNVVERYAPNVTPEFLEKIILKYL